MDLLPPIGHSNQFNNNGAGSQMPYLKLEDFNKLTRTTTLTPQDVKELKDLRKSGKYPIKSLAKKLSRDDAVLVVTADEVAALAEGVYKACILRLAEDAPGKGYIVVLNKDIFHVHSIAGDSIYTDRIVLSVSSEGKEVEEILALGNRASTCLEKDEEVLGK